MRVQGLARRVSQACFSAERWARSSGGTFHSSTYATQKSSAAWDWPFSDQHPIGGSLTPSHRTRLTLPPTPDRVRIHHLLGLADLAPEGPLEQGRDLAENEDGGGVLDDADAEVGGVVDVFGREGRAREDELDVEPRERERAEREGGRGEEAALEGRARVEPDWAPEGGVVDLRR